MFFIYSDVSQLDSSSFLFILHAEYSTDQLLLACISGLVLFRFVSLYRV